MLHRSETWPVREENEVALQQAEISMVRWRCSVKAEFQVELREWLALNDIILVLQQNRLSWYGHVLQKEHNNWVKKCMEHEVEGVRPRARKKWTRREAVQKDDHNNFYYYKKIISEWAKRAHTYAKAKNPAFGKKLSHLYMICLLFHLHVNTNIIQSSDKIIQY